MARWAERLLLGWLPGARVELDVRWQVSVQSDAQVVGQGPVNGGELTRLDRRQLRVQVLLEHTHGLGWAGGRGCSLR